MKQRFSNEDIDRHIANCDGAGFPTNSTIGVMTQLRDDRANLIAAMKRLRDGRFNSVGEVDALIDDVLNEVE